MAEYIEREALLRKAIEEKRFVFQMEDLLHNEVIFQTVYKDLADFILSAPAADVAPVVHGEWKKEVCSNGWNEWDNLICKNCGTKFERVAWPSKWHFCPFCGADMRERNEHE